MRHLLAVITVFLYHLTMASGAQAQLSNDGLDVGEAMILMKHLLKDLRRTADIDQQYSMWLRARETLDEIVDGLPRRERDYWKRRLEAAIDNDLREPAAVHTPDGVTFNLMEVRGKSFYWSDPVTAGNFVEYLNSNRVPQAAVETWVDLTNSPIDYDNETRKYTARRPATALKAVSYNGAAQFAKWLSRRQKQHCRLPGRDLVRLVGSEEITCWSSSKWKVDDLLRRENMRMFGVSFRTLVHRGEPVGELSEARYPDAEIRLITSIRAAKRFYLKQLQELQ
ncbi:MAG: SUMF1/EgtB/PvdO family nonheme iron enzyme [Lentisphaeria bacterium]|jgi:hypothetical protein|nr:SUMF1/EgtB/PvdO family nonheme iron enzyme [Lentisphaeria bacterium]